MARRLKTDVVIIGSGAAGGTAAHVLAGHGAKVILLEEGPRANTSDFNGDLFGSIKSYYRNAGGLVALGSPLIPVQAGCVVGGSTTMNSGTSFRTPDNILEGWSAAVGGAFTSAEMAGYFERVERDLNITEVPPELAFPGERMLLEVALQRGHSGGYVKRNVIACQGTGYCSFGCPTGAKQSLEQVYIPAAEANGAEVLPLTRAERVIMRGRQAVGVMAQGLGPGGEELEIHADAVIMAAGALHSPLLLSRSLDRDTPHAVGQNLFLHPATHVIGIFPDDVHPRMGSIQSIYIDGPNDEYVIFGMIYPPEIIGPLTTERGSGIRTIMEWNRSVGVAVMASDHGRGGRLFDGLGQPQMVYSLGDGVADSLVEGTARAAELLLEAGAQRVHCTIRGMDPISSAADVRALRAGVPKARLNLGSVHPMGTARMGRDPKTSAVDPFNEVHGVRGLFVPDASFFPSSLGVNPQVTVMAFAMRCAEHIAKLGALG